MKSKKAGQLMIDNIDSKNLTQNEVVKFLKAVSDKPNLKAFELKDEIKYALKSLLKEYSILNYKKPAIKDRVVLNTILEDALIEAMSFISQSKSLRNSETIIKIIQENLEIQRKSLDITKLEILKTKNISKILSVVYNRLSN